MIKLNNATQEKMNCITEQHSHAYHKSFLFLFCFFYSLLFVLCLACCFATFRESDSKGERERKGKSADGVV